MSLPKRPTFGGRTRLAFIVVVSFAAGAVLRSVPFGTPTAARVQGHEKADGIKAPVAEVLHCPLAFAGVHLLKDKTEVAQVAYHYCKPLGDNLAQCLLYDGTGPDAHLIGTEYLVSDAVFQAMPEEEKAYWHDHKYEVDAGLIRSLTQSGSEEKKTLAVVRTLYGKIYHTWNSGKTYPSGPARLFWSVTGKEPFVLPPNAELPPQVTRPK